MGKLSIYGMSIIIFRSQYTDSICVTMSLRIKAQGIILAKDMFWIWFKLSDNKQKTAVFNTTEQTTSRNIC